MDPNEALKKLRDAVEALDIRSDMTAIETKTITGEGCLTMSMSIFGFGNWGATDDGWTRDIYLGEQRIARAHVDLDESAYGLLIPDGSYCWRPYGQRSQAPSDLAIGPLEQAAMHHAMVTLVAWLSEQLSDTARAVDGIGS